MSAVPSRRLRLAVATTPASPELPLPRPHQRVSVLSDRELQVLELTADGLTNSEIGKRLLISEETVKTHLRKVLAKLLARSRSHAVAVGFRRGLIT